MEKERKALRWRYPSPSFTYAAIPMSDAEIASNSNISVRSIIRLWILKIGGLENPSSTTLSLKEWRRLSETNPFMQEHMLFPTKRLPAHPSLLFTPLIGFDDEVDRFLLPLVTKYMYAPYWSVVRVRWYYPNGGIRKDSDKLSEKEVEKMNAIMMEAPDLPFQRALYLEAPNELSPEFYAQRMQKLQPVIKLSIERAKQDNDFVVPLPFPKAVPKANMRLERNDVPFTETSFSDFVVYPRKQLREVVVPPKPVPEPIELPPAPSKVLTEEGLMETLAKGPLAYLLYTLTGERTARVVKSKPKKAKLGYVADKPLIPVIKETVQQPSRATYLAGKVKVSENVSRASPQNVSVKLGRVKRLEEIKPSRAARVTGRIRINDDSMKATAKEIPLELQRVEMTDEVAPEKAQEFNNPYDISDLFDGRRGGLPIEPKPVPREYGSSEEEEYDDDDDGYETPTETSPMFFVPKSPRVRESKPKLRVGKPKRWDSVFQPLASPLAKASKRKKLSELHRMQTVSKPWIPMRPLLRTEREAEMTNAPKSKRSKKVVPALLADPSPLVLLPASSRASRKKREQKRKKIRDMVLKLYKLAKRDPTLFNFDMLQDTLSAEVAENPALLSNISSDPDVVLASILKQVDNMSDITRDLIWNAVENLTPEQRRDPLTLWFNIRSFLPKITKKTQNLSGFGKI